MYYCFVITIKEKHRAEAIVLVVIEETNLWCNLLS